MTWWRGTGKAVTWKRNRLVFWLMIGSNSSSAVQQKIDKLTVASFSRNYGKEAGAQRYVATIKSCCAQMQSLHWEGILGGGGCAQLTQGGSLLWKNIPGTLSCWRGPLMHGSGSNQAATIDERNPANHLRCLQPCKFQNLFHINRCKTSWRSLCYCWDWTPAPVVPASIFHGGLDSSCTCEITEAGCSSMSYFCLSGRWQSCLDVREAPTS